MVKTPANHVQLILILGFCSNVFPHIIERYIIAYKCKQGLKLLILSQIYLFALIAGNLLSTNL